MNNRRSHQDRNLDNTRSQYGAQDSRDDRSGRERAGTRYDLHWGSSLDDRDMNTEAEETFLDDYRSHHHLPPIPREHSRFEPDDDFRYFENGNRYSQQYVAQKDQGLWSSVKSYFGKGPKGYQRSDERIHEDVCDLLYRDHRIDASDIEVEVKEGVVFLMGSIENRQLKRLVEDEVERCPGVRDVHNRLRIASKLGI